MKLCVLCVSVVRFAGKYHHRGTEDTEVHREEDLVTFEATLSTIIFRRPPVSNRRSAGRDVDYRPRLRADERGESQATGFQ